MFVRSVAVAVTAVTAVTPPLRLLQLDDDCIALWVLVFVLFWCTVPGRTTYNRRQGQRRLRYGMALLSNLLMTAVTFMLFVNVVVSLWVCLAC